MFLFNHKFLDLIKTLTKERNLAVILITHDMGVIAETADQSGCNEKWRCS